MLRGYKEGIPLDFFIFKLTPEDGLHELFGVMFKAAPDQVGKRGYGNALGCKHPEPYLFKSLLDMLDVVLITNRDLFCYLSLGFSFFGQFNDLDLIGKRDLAIGDDINR